MQKTRTNPWPAKLGCLILFGILLLCALGPAQAFTVGETYDSRNWEEIKQFGPPALINWVKKGDFIINTKELEFEWRVVDPEFVEETKKNEGRFEIDEKGYTVDKKTKKRPEFIFGYPFPNIDPKDPKAGGKIMENSVFLRYRAGGFTSTGTITWVGRGGKEREVLVGGDYLYYQGRYGGPIKNNPRSFLEQQMIFVIEPFDLRGTVQMTWIYDDEKLDTGFAYVPMLRRVRRVSPSTRSDPFLGSDMCTDDANLWVGKNQTMEWKLIGETTILAPFTTEKNIQITEDGGGIIYIQTPPVQIGYEVKGWQGAPWALVDAAWHPQPAWIVEGMPKDPYYNYGRQLFYVDKNTFTAWFKEIYDWSEEYWKTAFITYSFQITQKGKDTIGNADLYVFVDDKNDHGTIGDPIQHPSRLYKLNMPADKIGPDHFTTATLIQLSK